MQLTFAAVREESPGSRFRGLFERAWPHYRRWWLADGEEARPSYLACRRAIDGLGVTPDVAVSDGTWDFVTPTVAHVEMRVKADRDCLSVAAASILAKVVRDREMRVLAESYPNWSFDTNKGYPCPVHKFALQGYGPSAIHRRTWVFMDNFVPWPGCPRTFRAEQPTLF